MCAMCVAEGVKRVDTVVYGYCQQKGISRVCEDVMVRVLFSFSCQVFL